MQPTGHDPTATETRQLGFLGRLVVVLAVCFVVVGILWHGAALDTIRRLCLDLVERPDKPMAFRFILQPGMAAIVGIRDGLRDARALRLPFFRAIVSRPQERAGRLRDGLNATARIILLGLLVDLIYQLLVLKRFYPTEAVVVALFVGFIPYVIIRGLATRIANRWFGNTPLRKIANQD
jgi:hypothetical protein